jgi:hypothetical protein
LRKPDGVNNWRSWLRGLLEDLFVIDAPTLYIQRNRAGKMIALQQLDGATIKRIIDDWGRSPQPIGNSYPPAYQQILKGLPAINYTARDLVYAPRNMRVHRAYGYSPVEQIVTTVNISLRRQLFQLQYYTEGNIPEALIGAPDAWTPDQIKAFQMYWDATFEGNTAQRRHAKFVPGGVAKTFIATKEPELKSLFDEWLARVVCFCFSISAQPFVSQVNRATAETQKETAEEEGLGAIKTWIKEVIDDVIAREFDAPDLMLSFLEEDEIDALTQETVLTGYTKSGGMRINEMRDRLGLDPDSDPAANTLMVLTQTGYVPIGAYADQQAAAATANAALAATPLAAPANDDTHKQPPPKKEVDKVAAIPFDRAKLGPVPYPRPMTRKAASAMLDLWIRRLAQQRSGIGGKIRGTLFKAAHEEGRHTVDDFMDSLDLGQTVGALSDISAGLSSVASDTGQLAYAQIGSQNDVFEQINDRASAWASDRAASLVSEVDDTTLDAVRRAIAQGIGDGLGASEIADSVEELGAFTEDRAQLIAHTEIANANSQGALVGYKTAKDSGIDVKKAWLLADEDVDDECADNADAGAIELDDIFPSGDDAPLAHPNCRCALVPVVGDEE